MDERQVHMEVVGGRQREVFYTSHALSEGFRMVGWREHEMLVAEGHYRCPHCRRADAMEMSDAGISRR